MRATEYALQYYDAVTGGSTSSQAAGDVAAAMIAEIMALAKARKSSSDEAMIAIVKELEQKWKAFLRRIDNPGLREDGFARCVRLTYPTLEPAFDVYGILKVGTDDNTN